MSSGSRYSLLEKKGEGAFSTVFAAQVLAAPDPTLHARHLAPMSPPVLRQGMRVAVKRIQRGVAAMVESRKSPKDKNKPRDTDHLSFLGATSTNLPSVPALPNDQGLAECDLLRRLTWTTNVYVGGVREEHDDASDSDSDHNPMLTSDDTLADFGNDPSFNIFSGKTRRPSRAVADKERMLGSGGGIVKLYEVIETADSLFFVMEYCALDLFQAITSRAGFPPHIVKDLFTQICNAVHYCHENGVFHRDLKPENILLDTSDYSIRLADFGLATDEEWSTNMGCGSLRYMSPENLGIPLATLVQDLPHSRSDPPGYNTLKNDVWSLGVLLMNLVYARNPWHGPKDPFCSRRYLYNREPALREEFNLSPEFDAILRRCFDPDPELRCGVIELRNMVWRVGSFTTNSDSLDESLNALLAEGPPPEPQLWGPVKKIFMGIPGVGAASTADDQSEEDHAVADTIASEAGKSGSTASIFAEQHRMLSSRRVSGRNGTGLSVTSDNSGPSLTAEQKKKLTVSMSVLQKLLDSTATDGRESITDAKKGVEMRLGDSKLSSLGTSSGDEDSGDDDDDDDDDKGNIFKSMNDARTVPAFEDNIFKSSNSGISRGMNNLTVGSAGRAEAAAAFTSREHLRDHTNLTAVRTYNDQGGFYAPNSHQVPSPSQASFGRTWPSQIDATEGRSPTTSRPMFNQILSPPVSPNQGGHHDNSKYRSSQFQSLAAKAAAVHRAETQSPLRSGSSSSDQSALEYDPILSPHLIGAQTQSQQQQQQQSLNHFQPYQQDIQSSKPGAPAVGGSPTSSHSGGFRSRMNSLEPHHLHQKMQQFPQQQQAIHLPVTPSVTAQPRSRMYSNERQQAPNSWPYTNDDYDNAMQEQQQQQYSHLKSNMPDAASRPRQYSNEKLNPPPFIRPRMHSNDVVLLSPIDSSGRYAPSSGFSGNGRVRSSSVSSGDATAAVLAAGHVFGVGGFGGAVSKNRAGNGAAVKMPWTGYEQQVQNSLKMPYTEWAEGEEDVRSHPTHDMDPNMDDEETSEYNGGPGVFHP
ncbi:hypothetical protein HDU81_002426 [Chytriomyces hyalinus]|nr:hypothetical protein HDU81_002426 [Chytriomyces hyalinus]